MFKLLAEFGPTIITLGHSLTLFPDVAPFQYGTNYLVSIFTIFPNIGDTLTPLVDKTIYVYHMPPSMREFLGDHTLENCIIVLEIIVFFCNSDRDASCLCF